MHLVSAVLAGVAVALAAAAVVPVNALAGTPTTITLFPLDVGHPVNLDGLVMGPDGNLWFGEHWWPEGSYTALIGRMDEAGRVDEFDEGLHPDSAPSEFVAAPDGNVWFADEGSTLSGAAIGKVAPDGAITRFTAGLGGSRPGKIVVGPDGNLWFTASRGSPAIGYVTPGGAISAFHLPADPWDLVAAPDGNVWFTYGGDNIAPAIGRVAMQKGGGAVITLFHSGLAADSHPSEIIAAGDHLWFSARRDAGVSIGRVSTNGVIDQFSTGADPEWGIWDIAAGPTGEVWFTNRGADAIGRVTPQGQIMEFSDPLLYEPLHITLGPDGNMWFTHQIGVGIGKITPAGEITILSDGFDLQADPQEIVAGPNGRLWFLSHNRESPAIGRIVPGDDTPPTSLSGASLSGPTIPPQSIGSLSLRGKSFQVSRGGKTILPLLCQSATPCVGSLRLMVLRNGWKAAQTIGASSFSIGSWGSTGVQVQLNRKGRKLLAEGGATTAKLRVSPTAVVPAWSQTLTLRPVSKRR